MLKISKNYRTRILLCLAVSAALSILFAYYIYGVLYEIELSTLLNNPDFTDATLVLLIFTVCVLLTCVLLPNMALITLRTIPAYLYLKDGRFYINGIAVEPKSTRKIERAISGTGKGQTVYYRLHLDMVPEELRSVMGKRDHIVFTAQWEILSLIFSNLKLKNRLNRAGFQDDILKEL